MSHNIYASDIYYALDFSGISRQALKTQLRFWLIAALPHGDGIGVVFHNRETSELTIWYLNQTKTQVSDFIARCPEEFRNTIDIVPFNLPAGKRLAYPDIHKKYHFVQDPRGLRKFIPDLSENTPPEVEYYSE